MADSRFVDVEILNNNCFFGRNGLRPSYIILHGTAGGTSAQAIANYFQTVAVSSNYVIGTDGTIVACVGEDNGAWANGYVSAGHDPWWSETNSPNPNNITISIEHCKPSQDNSDSLTPAQQDASFKLIADICQRWNIPKRSADANGGITGHFSIDPINRSRCPGNYPWDKLWAFLNSGGTPTPQPINLEGNVNVEKQADDTYKSTDGLLQAAYKASARTDSGIYHSWRQAYLHGHNVGGPLTLEFNSVDWNGNHIVVVQFVQARCEWDGSKGHFYDANDAEIYAA